MYLLLAWYFYMLIMFLCLQIIYRLIATEKMHLLMTEEGGWTEI